MNYAYAFMGSKKLAYLLIIILTVVFGTLYSIHSVFGIGTGWISEDDPSQVVLQEPFEEGTIYEAYELCPQYTRVKVYVSGDLTQREACMTYAKSFRMGTVKYPNGYIQTVVAFGGDQKVYALNNFSFGSYRPLILPGTNTVIMQPPQGSGGARQFHLYEDFQKYLIRDPYSTIANTSYNLELGDSDFTIQTTENEYHYTRGVAASENGKWITAKVEGYLVRINAETHDMKLFGRNMFGNASPGLAISNDGQYVFASAGGQYYTYAIRNGCEKEVSEANILASYAADPCEMKDREISVPSNISALSKPVDVSFSDDGGIVNFIYGTSGWDLETYMPEYQHRFKLSAPGYAEPTQLDYLALGDSYSSGEGDTTLSVTGGKYYRQGTDIDGDSSNPREKCHISTRSYPYVLAKGMGLGLPVNNSASTKWQTIACSGAKVVDVVPEDKGSDRGQDSRLEGYSNYADLKTQALNEMIPGRVKQIEFVKRHQPKVITLTMGGNDIGFGEKIYACANPFSSESTCKHANQEGRTLLASTIKNRYDELVNLYRELYEASGKQTKIYVIGYPQFINSDPNGACTAHNIGQLNPAEREMIGNSVTYLNNVIEQAAKATGVKYIDIEDSLIGHKLCDSGQKYVTGVTNIIGWYGNEIQESFHPNSHGQFEIAKSVSAGLGYQSPLAYDVCPLTTANICPDSSATKDEIAVPEYFQGQTSDTKVAYAKLTTSDLAKESLKVITTPTYIFRPGSTAQLILHSDPVELGDYTVSADGSLDAGFTVPASVPAGYHTLTLVGETYSGEPIQYEQVLLVRGTDPADIDENNVVDAQQLCGPFMAAANIDTDMDGVDDACDPAISELPDLYRVRQGDSERTYNGQPEKDYYLYIERNTRASSITGITGDYDPDGDGWAIVGASQGVQYTGTTVPDTGPASNFVVTGAGSASEPYVYIRAGGWGCVGLTPTSLTVVEPGQERTLKKSVTNTDKCRTEAPEDDIDFNGLEDNEQPLYSARNGDSAKGESPSRIYLYRNFYSAESQLGISDYTPTGTAANTIAAVPLIADIAIPPNHPTFGRALESIRPWNLLAVSKASEPTPTFNKLITLNSDHPANTTDHPLPIILTKKQNNQCIAYKPQSTDVIKFNQNNILVKLSVLPEGVECE